MKKTYLITIIILVLINIYLLFKTNKKPIIVQYNQRAIIDSLINDKKLTITKDSLFLDSIEKSYISKIRNLKYSIKNERNKFKEQISKFDRIVDSTDFARINDSIKKVCCSDRRN